VRFDVGRRFQNYPEIRRYICGFWQLLDICYLLLVIHDCNPAVCPPWEHHPTGDPIALGKKEINTHITNNLKQITHGIRNSPGVPGIRLRAACPPRETRA
jgi:hypothetical protein